MDKRQLGGLTVSSIGLGTSTWGTKTDIDDAARQLGMFADAGGNLLDTADVYGESQSFVGKVIAGRRDEFVIATKAGAVRVVDGLPRGDCSAQHLRASLEKSLRQLDVDHIDLWQLHGWDPDTPLDETLSVVDEAISSGKVRYAGVCNYNTKQLLAAAESGLISSLQTEYSLLERRIERNVVPACAELGVGVLPWAALGRGVLTGKYLGGVPDKRLNSRFFQWYVQPFLDERATRIVRTVAEVADGLGVTPLGVALAWVSDRTGVVSSLIGARSSDQLRESLDAEGVVLPEDARRTLDQASAPVYR